MKVVTQVRRAGRRVLAYPRVRRASLAVVARFPAAKKVGNAVLGTPPEPRRRGIIDIRPGRYFAGEKGARRLPIVVVVALGLGPGDTEALAREIEVAQMTSGSFRPLFVVDSGELGPFRTRSFAVEAVMTPEAYRRLNPQDAYTEYVHERVTAIAHGYRASAVVPMPPGGVGDYPRHVLRLIGALPRR